MIGIAGSGLGVRPKCGSNLRAMRVVVGLYCVLQSRGSMSGCRLVGMVRFEGGMWTAAVWRRKNKSGWVVSKADAAGCDK